MIDAQWLIESLSSFAVFGVALIIYFETATILGSFLPGDSLLFLLGLTLATVLTDFPLPIAMAIVLVAAVAGAQTGFWVGKKTGPKLFKKEHGWFFTTKTVERTSQFFDRYGARAIILARFIPIMRALVPMFVAIGGFDAQRFLRLNIFGGIAWVVGLMTIGYALGNVSWVKQNIELAVIIFVVISSLPLPFELIREARARRLAKRQS